MEGENRKQEPKNQQKIRTMQKDIARLKGLEDQKEGIPVAEPEEEKIEIGKMRELARKKAEEKKLQAEAEKKIAQAEGEKKEEEIATEKKAATEAEADRAKKEEEEKRLTEEEREKRTMEETERIKKEKILAKKAEEERLADIDKGIGNIDLRKKEINKEKQQFLEEIKNFETRLEPVSKEETVIENKIREVEELEKKASPEKQSQIEKKRWEIDTKRREIEKAKWQILEEIEKVEEKIKEVESKIQEASNEQDQLKMEKGKILQKRQEEELIKEKARLKNEFSQLDEEKKIVKDKENELSAKEKNAETELEKILKEEKITEEVIQEVEKKERQTSDLKEQRKIEKERWKIDDDRKDLESKKWSLEKEKKESSTLLEEIQIQYREIVEKENLLKERLKEINLQLKIPPEEEEFSKSEYTPTAKKEEEEKGKKGEEGGKREEPIESIKEETTSQSEKKTVESLEKEMIEKEEEERRMIVKEEMKKRIAEAAEKRRQEEILRGEQTETDREFPPSENSETKSGAPETFISILPEKPSLFEKISIRLMIIAILLLTAGFFYWLFTKEKIELPEQEIIPPEEEIIETETPPAEEEIIEKPEIIIPVSLIQTESTETIKIASPSEIPALLAQLLEKDFGAEGHTRILFENTSENKIVGLKEFLETFEVETPEGLLEKLDDDFTLFAYSKDTDNRLGFIVRIEEKDNLTSLMRSWEAEMEKDTEKLFETLGRESIGTPLSFKGTTYKNVAFRYISFPQNNFGICWGTYEDSLIFTSSGESMIRSIDKLQL